MEKVRIHGKRCVAALVLRDGNLVFLGECDQGFPALEIPLPPRRDHRDLGLQRIIPELEAHLIVALARRAMGHSVGANLSRDFNLLFGDQGPRNRRPQKIKTFILRVGPEHGEHIIADKFLAQIFNVNVLWLDAEQQSLGARGFKLLALAQIGREGHHFAAVGCLEPLENNGRVQPPRIGENDALDAVGGHVTTHQDVGGPIGLPEAPHYSCARSGRKTAAKTAAISAAMSA